MRILAFETSAKAASVALVQDGILVAESYQNSGLTHSRTLLAMAEDLLKSCELTVRDLDACAVAEGPGSFTGVRIGVAAAKGLAWGRELPLYGVSTLEAMARSLGERDAVVCAAMDARRSQVYNAIFRSRDGVLTRLTPDRAISIAELAAELSQIPGEIVFVGDGAALCWNSIGINEERFHLSPEHRRHQRASGVALCALDAAKAGRPCDAAALQPNYLRLSQAERERMERLQNT